MGVVRESPAYAHAKVGGVGKGWTTDGKSQTLPTLCPGNGYEGWE